MNNHQTSFYTKALEGVIARIAELETLVATKPATGTYYSNQLANAIERKSKYETMLKG
jgi:hypothetical protein